MDVWAIVTFVVLGSVVVGAYFAGRAADREVEARDARIDKLNDLLDSEIQRSNELRDALRAAQASAAVANLRADNLTRPSRN